MSVIRACKDTDSLCLLAPRMLYTIFLAVGLVCRVSAQFMLIPYNNTYNAPVVGPDGPWYAVIVATGANPMQFVTMYPIFNASTGWFVGALNCNNASQSCTQPANTYYDSTSSSALTTPPLSAMENSSALTFGDIYPSTGQLLNTTGSFGYWHAESFITAPNIGQLDPFFVRGMSQLTSNYTNVQFPNGASYVPISMFTLDPGIVYLPATTNDSYYDYNFLSNLYNNSAVASASWAMHVGSVAQQINGSLICGSYDQTRLIGNAGAFSSSSVKMTSLSLGASSGGYNWSAAQMDQNYLGSSSSGLQVSINSAVPYSYLPTSVSSSLAQVLPISYDTRFNLYTWQTANQSYNSMVTSPTYLNFTFSTSNNEPISIRVPLALLNLTLSAPLVSEPLSYFPCSPNDDPSLFTLGRAFLQAAYIGQNYNSSTFWIGQAPGPTDLADFPVIKTINPSTTTLVADATGKTWEQSWAGVLKALPPSSASDGGGTSSNEGGGDGSESSPTATPSPMASGNSQISGGAIAGIVIGVLAIVAIVASGAFIFGRRSRQPQQTAVGGTNISEMPAEKSAKGNVPDEKFRDIRKWKADAVHTGAEGSHSAYVEAPSYNGLSEMPPGERRIFAEAPGDMPS